MNYFIRVADIGNFTRAAEELHISQSALSRAIQRLEDDFGQPLLERTSRSVSLTDAGQLVRARVEQVLAILQDTKAEITDDGQSGRIRLGAIPTIAPYFLPGLLKSFSAEHPKAQLLVQEDTTDRLINRCKQGELDVLVLALPIPAKYLEVTRLFEEELFLVVPNDHPLASKRQIKIGDIEPFPFVLLDEAHCLSESIVSFCRQKHFQPVAVERTSQLAMVQELVSLSHGVSMVPAMARRIDKSKQRTYRALSGKRPARTIAAVSNPYRFHSRLLQAFIAALQDYAQQFAGNDKGQ